MNQQQKQQTSLLLDLKSRYLQHILAVSSPKSEAEPDGDRDPCCAMCSSKRVYCSAEGEGDHTLLVEQEISALSPPEKDEMILNLHAKLRRLNERLNDVIAFSERTVSDLERAHQDAVKERAASEQRWLQELNRWKHRHPEVQELHKENACLREDRDRCQRQYLIALGKLARGKKANVECHTAREEHRMRK